MARLPQPGGDKGAWGSILNDFLSQSHKTDGSLKNNIVDSNALAPNAVDETILGATGGSDGQVLSKDTASSTGLSWRSVSGGTTPDASSSVKGIVQLAGDLAGTAASPTVPGLASKANDSAVVHLAGAETVTGVKTYSASPVVPTPTTNSQAANKSYVDGVAGAGAPDATSSVKGVVQLTGDLSGTAASPTVPGLASKANDSAVVHNSGTETIAGVKTFSSSPVVPTPTTGTQATNKSYVDGVAAAGAPDATTSTKGIVQLAGDLAGTATSPTVPGLATKPDDSVVVHNTGAETVAGVKTFSSSPVVPTPTTSTQAANKSYVDGVAAAGAPDATTSTKGIVQLAGDLAGTAASPTVPGLASKANDSAVVHNTGAETVAGVKTFSSSPVVPTPTTSTQAANKSYVDGVAGAGAPDATTTSKGIVQLAGDLAGTATAPTVPGLATKADEVRTITGANSITGGGDLSANRTLALVGDSASPGNSRYYGTNAGGTKGWHALSGGTSVGYEHIFLDDMAGATDDDKLTAAISAQQATAGMPPIVLAARNHTFNQTRNLYSGLKLIGQSTGPKNLEQDPDFVTSRITLGGAVSSGTSSWWVTPGGNLFDIYMADFAVQGNSGSSVHQFMDVNTGSLYACEFHSLAFNFMRSVMGRKDRTCLMTQVVLSGHWTANNLWDTQFHLAGSDNSFWMGGMINIGPSSSPAQTGTYADNDYEIMFNNCSKTNVGYIYMTALNGWRGIRVQGSSSFITFYGGVYEGYNAGTPAPGTVIRLEGGVGTFYGPNIGQGMGSPDAAEGGLVHITGGEWNFYGPIFYRGNMTDTTPCVYQTGGRVYVTGATRRQSETWSARPVLQTGAGGGNAAGTGTYTTYVPDLSMNVT